MRGGPSASRERSRLFGRGHKDFSFFDIGLLCLTNQVGVENVRRSAGCYMKRIFENTRDILPISLEKACTFYRTPELFKFVCKDDSRKAISRLFSGLRSGGGRQRSARVRLLKRAGWCIFILQTLNSMYLGGYSFSKAQRVACFSQPGDLLPCHVFALKNILSAVNRFDGVAPLSSRGLGALLTSIDLDEGRYSGKSYPAEDIIFDEHSLPEQCSSCDASSLLYDDLPFLEEPELVLRKDVQSLPAAQLRPKKVWASDEEWNKFCRLAIARGLFEHIAAEDIFTVNGRRILSGAFAVPKVAKPPLFKKRQRFILNLNNEIWDISLAPEIATPDLPYAPSFTIILIGPNEIWMNGSEDEECCFYQWFLPQVWRKYFVMAKQYVDAAGVSHWVTLTGIPMGWGFSVGILQCLQRFFLKLAGAPLSQEVRPSRMFPCYEEKSIYSVYVDNFAEFSMMSLSEAEKVFDSANRESPLQKEYVSLKQQHGVSMNKQDHTAGEVEFDYLGAFFDRQYFGLSRGKRVLIMYCLCLIIFGDGCSYQQLASLIGITSHSFLFKRALFAVFDETYSFLLRFCGGHWLPEVIRSELRAACALLVFAEADLRLPVDPFLYSSDASLWGGAFGRTKQFYVQRNTEARDLLRKCDVRGTAIRLDTAAPQPCFGRDPATSERIPSIPIPDESQWKVLKAFPFSKVSRGVAERSDLHITLLECITYTFLFRHLSSRVGNAKYHVFGQETLEDCLELFDARRIFVGLDSRGAHGAFSKGRSSARRVNRQCRKVCCLSIASGILPFYFWIPSEDMPMDRGSRKFQPGKKPPESGVS